MKSLSSIALSAPLLLLAAAGASARPQLIANDPAVVYALTSQRTANRLISFHAGTPRIRRSDVAVSGLQPGEILLGIDFRPATGELFALGSTSQIYVVNPGTGSAAPVAASPFAPALSGGEFGLDFNPVVDRIRGVSDLDQNLRLNPNTGKVAATDGAIAFALGDPNFGFDPVLVGSGYTNSFTGTTTTTLLGIEVGRDVLVTQGSPGGSPVSPNTGTLFTVGSLGVDAGSLVGFDITPFGGAFAALTAPAAASSQLYTVNLATGATTLVGTIGGSETVRAIALQL